MGSAKVAGWRGIAGLPNSCRYKLDTRTACRRLHVLAVLLACWRSPVMKPGVACLLEIACTRGAACWRATDHLWHGRPAASSDRCIKLLLE
ncbi:hypothetical protein PVAP13_8KG283401 [Panicum virgatum]|uniref:Uncharacterized protein n=1 Tax=Panicum virgatum TaxID=38727 RepID=A0A8T0PJS0_PANVG|nr:hypothetical protein PVAP13_8KG283401 [Panicum virgatum]